MKKTKHLVLLLVLTLFVLTISCEKQSDDEEAKQGELLFRLDSIGDKVYYFKDCNDELTIDSVGVEEGVIFTFTGCGQVAKYIAKPDWYYNCYPVYDYWGYYLYDDCYWEYYTEFDIEKDSLISAQLFQHFPLELSLR